MTYRFADVEIDTARYRVTRAGEPVHFEPKAMELLVFLAANPGRLVTKSEIQQVVWKDTFVTENALTRLVAQIRRGLGDEARGARYIETVPTKGYRFVACLGRPADGAASAGEASSLEQPAAAAAAGASPPHRRRKDDAVAGSAAPEQAVTGIDIAPSPAGPAPAAPGQGRLHRPVLLLTLALAVVAAVLALRAGGPAATPVALARPAPAVRLEMQASTRTGLNVFPAFSPDGGSLAFSTLRGSSMEIVVRALAPGAREVAVTSDGLQNVQPVFSPDGRLLAYHSIGRGGIWVVPALGGVPRQLTRWGSEPAWSPDGSRIAFQSQSWVGSGAGQSPAGEGSTIWIVASSGGEPARLTSIADVGPGGQGAPAWSPDGRLVSFIAGTRVFCVRADGSGLRRTGGGSGAAGANHHLTNVWINGMAWEPGGRSQVWTGSQDGNWFAWRVPVSPEDGSITGEAEVIAGGGESAAAWFHPVVSPDGRTLAHVTFRTRHELVEQPLDAAGRPRGAPRPLATNVAGRKIPLGISRDGLRVAFGTARPGVGRAIWVADTGREARLVVEQPGITWARAFFPDGRLGYVTTASGSPLVFHEVDPETGSTGPRVTLEPALGWTPVVSPDGTRLALHAARQGGLNVWVVELRDGRSRQLTFDAEGIGWPAWSPDGRTLAVEMMRDGNTHIGLLSAAGGQVREFVAAPGQSWPESFSPDGRRVAFAGQRNALWNIYWAPVDGGAEQRVSDYAQPSTYVRYPVWSPAGDRVVYEYGDSTSTVWTTSLAPAR